MRQLQDKRVVYVEDDRDYYDMAPRQDYDVVYIRRPRQRRRPFHPDRLILGTFWVGVFFLVMLSFVVESPEWLLKRGAFVVVMMVILAVGIAIVGTMWIAIKDLFFPWRDE